MIINILINLARKLTKIEKYTALTFLLFGFLFFHLAENMLIVKPDGLYVGQVNLYGDLVFHLSLINKFLASGKILPDNPIFAGDKINYPPFADFITAQIARLTNINFSLFIITFLMGLSTIYVCRYFIKIFFKNDKIVFLSLLLFFLNGGFGFYYFFKDYLYSGRTIFDFLFAMSNQYTDIKEKGYWWINNLLAYFLPQRAFLFAFPITLTILIFIYFGIKKNRTLYFIYAGILAGILPLIQVHSLILLFILCLFYFPASVLNQKNKSKNKLFLNWLLFGFITAILSIPLFISISSLGNSFSQIQAHFGWVSKENIFWFWFKNLGFFAPVLVISIIWFYFKNRYIFYLYVPFLVVFLICNVIIFQPWDFDNGKLLIYWYFTSCILVAYFIYDQLLTESFIKKLFALVLIFFMIFASSLDIFRTFTNVTFYRIFSTEDLQVARQIERLTSPDAILLTAQNHNNPIPALSGRSTLVGYPGWLWSHGIKFQDRLNSIYQIYKGEATAQLLIQKYKINYVAIGPQEKQSFPINDTFFVKYPRIQINPQWSIYDVSNIWSNGNWQNQPGY